MKVLIFGGSGGLGSKITTKFEMDGIDVKSLSSKDIDLDCIDSFFQIEEYLQNFTPDVIINMAVKNIDGMIYKKRLIDLQSEVNINILSAVRILKSSVMYFKSKEKGKIILCSSYLADRPVVGTGIYSGCKAFTDSIVKTVALENVKYNITCNSIRMGYFDGGLTYKIPEKFFNTLKESIPMKRFGTIDELYSAMKFLIENDYVTGTNLVIDGGMSLI